jgi:hypothetical protein
MTMSTLGLFRHEACAAGRIRPLIEAFRNKPAGTTSERKWHQQEASLHILQEAACSEQILLSRAFSLLREGRLFQRDHPMPRRRRSNFDFVPRLPLPALELETKILGPLRGLKECAKLKGVRFVYVGSLGREPNWFAQPIPSVVSGTCRRRFVSALARVRKEFDMLPA